MNAQLEIACFNKESAEIAFLAGADRVELCSGFSEGGLSPDEQDIKWVLDKCQIPVMVMIRPRGGSFSYTGEEFDCMKKQVEEFRKLGVSGFVFGVLDESNEVDLEKNISLVKLADGCPCTFHRAFDIVKHPVLELEKIINAGFTSVLTSGQQPTAWDGKDLLKVLIIKAAGRIQILPGGGIRSSTIKLLHEELNTPFYHSSAITSESGVANPDEIKKLKNNLR